MTELLLNVIVRGAEWGCVTPIAVLDNDKAALLRERIIRDVDVGDRKLSSILLWKPLSSISSSTYDPAAFGDLPMIAIQLDPLLQLSHYFPPPLSETELHIIVAWAPSPHTPPLGATIRAIDVDIGEYHKRLRQSLPTLQELRDGYLSNRLREDQKIAIHPDGLQALITLDCDEGALKELFRPTTTVHILGPQVDLFRAAITREPPSTTTSEGGLISFWDRNVRDIVEHLIKGGKSIRDSNRLTETKLCRPDFGFSLRGFCPLRGEEKGLETEGDPEKELRTKLTWNFDPADYVFGYFVRYTDFVICAILRPEDGAVPTIQRLASADLADRRERVKNLIRLIHLCDLLPLVADIAARDSAEYYTVMREDKSIQVDPTIIKMRFKVNPDERIAHLKSIYGALAAKRVRNVDRVLYISNRTATVVLEPRGKQADPTTTSAMFDVIKCVLEALVDMHAEPPIFHRDIRWPNIIQDPTDTSKYFLIDFDDATGMPTRAAKLLEPALHCATVFHDNHGPEVDLWAVGRLIWEFPAAPESMRRLAQDLETHRISTAQQALIQLLAIEGDCCPPSTSPILSPVAA